MRIYRGPEPCPGCQRPGSEQYRESKTAICSNCREALKFGYAAIKKKNETPIEDQLIKFRFSSATGAHDHNYFNNQRYNRIYYVSSAASDMLRDALMSFLKTLDEGEQPVTNHDSMGNYAYHVQIHIRHSRLEEFYRLIHAFALYVLEAKKESYNSGKDLLFGLADGRLSVKDFNERMNGKKE